MAQNAEGNDRRATYGRKTEESGRDFQVEQSRQRNVRERMTRFTSTDSQGVPCTLEKIYKDKAGNPYKNIFTTEFAEDGRTLLEFVVYSRRPEEDIRMIVQDIIKYVGLNVLVFQLRKSDAWGAPLLFQAVSGKPSGQSASSTSLRGISSEQNPAPRSRASCFKFVAEIISSHLGKGGLAEQLRSIDREGHSLRMYAARSREEGLYEEVEKMMKENDVLDNLEHRDNRGYTLLHHAAESGSLATLKAVTKSLRTQSDFRRKFLDKKDRHGMTPANRLLSKQIGEGEFGEFEEKARHLMNVCTCPEYPHDENSCDEENLKVLDVEGVIFAARGGARNLTIAIRLRSEHTGIPRLNDSQQPSLRSKLGHIFGDGDEGASQVERLLVQAALGGQRDVLQAVLEDESLPPQHGDTTAPNGGTSPVNGGASPDDRSTNRDGGGGGGGGGGNRDGYIWPLLSDREKVMKKRDFKFAAIELGSVGDDHNEGGNTEKREICEGSLFTLTILSGEVTAISWAKDFTLQHVTEESKAWDMIRGKEDCISSLTYAASAPLENGIAAFEAVLTALKKAAEQAVGTGDPKKKLREEFKGGPDKCCKRYRLSPLAAAAFCGNKKLFLKVQQAYSKEFGENWCPDEVLGQLLRGTLIRRESLIRRKTGKSVCQQEIRFLPRDGGDEAQIPTAMWADIMDMVIKVHQCHPSHLLDQRKRSRPLAEWRASFTNSVKKAVGQGDFKDLRALIRMKFRMEDIIPSLLEQIGDNEEGLTSNIMCAIKYSSNPLIMCAVASRHIMDTKGTLPPHREGLGRLQAKVDEFTKELLKRLPMTVRDFGRKLVGARPPTTYEKSSNEWRKRRKRLSYLVGYITVRQLLEPNQSHMFQDDDRVVECESLDPIQQAMERCSGALYFINSPLVLDYMHITFSRTLPHWLARDPFRYDVNTGFHKYFPGLEIRGENFLLRTMQGWDARRTGELRMPKSAFPPRMILPGLQFSLAGIIGKPDAFFMVPAVRFVFMLWSYVVMVGLYVSCLPPEDSDRIPLNERAFYIFSLGLLYREILEFQETMPHQKLVYNPGDCLSKEYRGSLAKSLRYSTAPHRVSIALTRYLFHDTWNILDVLMIFTILVALVTRLMGMGGRWRSGDEYEDDDSATDDASLEFARWAFFFSRYALATVAPMLFARFLFLSQIDPTLGPMTQVIWTMIFHLARFSFFLLVHLIGFALTFYALFSECKGDLGDRFDNFSTSLLTLFGSMLGDFDFDMFSDENSSCEGSSYAAYDIGILLMVVYLVVMTILLLNLLIAVLSTAHSEVHKNSVPEFNLAAGKMIFKNAKAVAQGIVPPPFNLLMVVIGLLVDTAGELYSLPWRLRTLFRNICAEKGDDSEAPSTFVPSSGKSWYFSLEGLLLRILFAFTMGLSSIVIYAFLWVISTPVIAWRAFRNVFPPKDEGVTWEAGYLRPLLATLAGLAGWMVAMLVVSLYSPFHMFFLILLWVRGILSTLEWYRWSCRIQKQERKERQPQPQRETQPSCLLCGIRVGGKNEPVAPDRVGQDDSPDTNARSRTERHHKSHENERCAIMPGEEGMTDNDWSEATRIVRENNHPQYDSETLAFGPVCFNIDGFLRMTTGQSVADLTRQVEGRDEKGRERDTDDREGISPPPDPIRMTTDQSVAGLTPRVEGRDEEGKESDMNDREGISPPSDPIREQSG